MLKELVRAFTLDVVAVYLYKSLFVSHSAPLVTDKVSVNTGMIADNLSVESLDVILNRTCVDDSVAVALLAHCKEALCGKSRSDAQLSRLLCYTERTVVTECCGIVAGKAYNLTVKGSDIAGRVEDSLLTLVCPTLRELSLDELKNLCLVGTETSLDADALFLHCLGGVIVVGKVI